MNWTSISAIAAGIALITSIISPVITTCITLRHQRKLYVLSTERKNFENRQKLFNDFLSSVGQFIVYRDEPQIHDLGKSYFVIYQYVPQEHWEKLDQLYMALVSRNFSLANELHPEIVHLISEIQQNTDSKL